MVKTKSLTWNDIEVGQIVRVIKADKMPFCVGDIVYKTTEFYTRKEKENIQEAIVIYIQSPELAAPCNTAAKELLNKLEFELIDDSDVPINYMNFIGKKEYLDGKYDQLNHLYKEGYLSPFDYEEMLFIINRESEDLNINFYYQSIVDRNHEKYCR